MDHLDTCLSIDTRVSALLGRMTLGRAHHEGPRGFGYPSARTRPHSTSGARDQRRPHAHHHRSSVLSHIHSGVDARCSATAEGHGAGGARGFWDRRCAGPHCHDPDRRSESHRRAVLGDHRRGLFVPRASAGSIVSRPCGLRRADLRPDLGDEIDPPSRPPPCGHRLWREADWPLQCRRRPSTSASAAGRFSAAH